MFWLQIKKKNWSRDYFNPGNLQNKGKKMYVLPAMEEYDYSEKRNIGLNGIFFAILVHNRFRKLLVNLKS